MLGAAVVLVALGIIGLFIFPWGGIVAGIVGLLLFVAFLAGFGRRAQSPTHDF
jgi:hypothetical protein